MFEIINLKIIKQIIIKKHTNSHKDLGLSIKCQRYAKIKTICTS